MAEERVQRRLAAILAADVVGYSRLMGGDEAGTLAALKLRRSEVLAPLVSQHGGRIFKLMGDGVLVEFPSVVDAVECAVEVQKGMAAANAALPADKQLLLRIGVSLGDVMVEGGDLYGDGVNLAARLEGLAEPAASAFPKQPIIKSPRSCGSATATWANNPSRISIGRSASIASARRRHPPEARRRLFRATSRPSSCCPSPI
jgi:Adenylate cyclase, family 3 (some proteins contain HAMP domain)